MSNSKKQTIEKIIDSTSDDSLKEREILFEKQRKERGFDDSDTWSLDFTFSKMIYPRLKLFKEIKVGYPMKLTEKKWDKILDKMIFSHEHLSRDDDDYDRWSEESLNKTKKINEGLRLFAKYYTNLWW